MPFKTFRNESKENYGDEVQIGHRMNDEQLMLGAVLRMADAMEKSVEDRLRIDRELKYYKELCVERRGKIESLERKISANEGVKTKMRNRIRVLENEIQNLKNG